MTTNKESHDDDSESGDSVLGLGGLDFSGVDFDGAEDGNSLTDLEKRALELERKILFGSFQKENVDPALQEEESLQRILELGDYLATGKYAQALKGSTANKFLSSVQDLNAENAVFAQEIRKHLFRRVENVFDCVVLEFVGVAALNLFLQLNYTGPSLDEAIAVDPTLARSKETPLEGINPHPAFATYLSAQPTQASVEETEEKKEGTITTSSFVHTKFHNAVLAELAVDGEWPCQVCEVPYLLLLARSILLPLADPNRPDWIQSTTEKDATISPPTCFTNWTSHLIGAKLWCARAAVAHGRLLQALEPPLKLWDELDSIFALCQTQHCPEIMEKDTELSWEQRNTAATVMLEWGLAQHHFDRPGMGRKAFVRAKEYSGLVMSVTGASGVRTKFQTKQTAQMLVEAESTSEPAEKESKTNEGDSIIVKSQKVDHPDPEDELLLERIKFEDESKNAIKDLTVLDQAILLALCLDVKNRNPTGDELTAEEMGAYLARVLDHHDDWMLYSTALLERAWLEFHRSHGRERAILQIQALADQHTNRLTLTQSTKKSIEESAPVQDRLRNLHTIVYPPRWGMIKDLADRYANLGIFMSAADLYTEIEHWDEVVECYRRSGRESKAEAIVRDRLAIQETPRMWAALGDITQDPQYWEKAVEVSKGRFSSAYTALGAYSFEKKDLVKAAEYYEKSLEIRPVAPAVWFRLGTISMQLCRWDTAFRAFSRVVQLEPEEHEAWANVAAIHMRNKNPAEAYPALQESLKHFRANWRVWTSKLYVCLDLKKYDEAVQACNSILDLKKQKQASDDIPPLEHRCVQAIVGGTIQNLQKARADRDEVALDSCKRSLGRVLALLNRLKASNNEPWLYETLAYFHEHLGSDDGEMLDNLMKEYRTLQSVPGWEKDDHQVIKICRVVSQCTDIQRRQATKESLSKSKFLVRGVITKVEKSRMDASKVPSEVGELKKLLDELEGDLNKL